MTRLMFGVSASSFATNMAVKTNAIPNEWSHSRAASAVQKSFYVDDGLTGASSVRKLLNSRRNCRSFSTKVGSFLESGNLTSLKPSVTFPST